MLSRMGQIGKAFAEPRFGSRKGFLWAQYFSALSRFGGFRAYFASDLSYVDRLVFVCAGNICRSPYAEFKARELGISSCSLGLRTRGGDPANPKALQIAANRGVDLSTHISRRLDEHTISDRDLYVCMEVWQAKALAHQTNARREQTVLQGMYCQPKMPHIPDPYGRNDTYFNRCFDWIDAGVTEIADLINHSGRG